MAPTPTVTSHRHSADVYAAARRPNTSRAERTVAVVANLYTTANAHANRIGNTVAVIASLWPAPYANATLTTVPFNQRRLGGTN